MSTLANMYSGMSAEDKEKLGRASNKIRTAGTHLVSIVEAAEIDNNRIRIDFKTDSGEIIDWTGWLNSKDENGNEIPNIRTMNQLTFICNAAGVKLPAVLGKTINTTKEFKNGSVPAVEFPVLAGKKLYVTTSTIIEGDKDNDTKVYVKQDIDPFKFFDTKKRNALEIQANIPEGLTMDAADAEAKEKIEVAYKFLGNEACERKLLELTEKHSAGASTIGQIGTPADTTPAESADDI